MSKLLNFRVPEGVYEQVEKASSGNKSAWLLEAVLQKLGRNTDGCKTDVIQRIEALEKAVFSKTSIHNEESVTLKGSNAARAIEAKEKVKQAILTFPDVISNAELSRLSNLDRGTIAKYRKIVLQEIGLSDKSSK
jgi:hypothetical protein